MLKGRRGVGLVVVVVVVVTERSIRLVWLERENISHDRLQQLNKDNNG
jgi:hypothetical protein